MHQHRFVDAIGELTEQLRAGVVAAAALGSVPAVTRVSRWLTEVASAPMSGWSVERSTRLAQPATDRDSLNLPGELADHLQLRVVAVRTARAGERRPVPAGGTKGPVSTSCFSQSPGRERVFPGLRLLVASGALWSPV